MPTIDNLEQASLEEIRDLLVTGWVRTEKNMGPGSGDDFFPVRIAALSAEFELLKSIGLQGAAVQKVFAIYGLRCLERDVARVKAAPTN